MFITLFVFSSTRNELDEMVVLKSMGFLISPSMKMEHTVFRNVDV